MSKAHWVALATTGRVGGKTITRLLAHFGSLEAAVGAPQEALRRVPGIGPTTAAAIAQIEMRCVEALYVQLAQEAIRVITWEDGDLYPANLLRCEDAPPVLFAKGLPKQEDNRAVAIVGTREPHSESAALAHQLGYQLACRGWTVVSGLALGIDGQAHHGALAAGGRTLAVLGSGVRRLYPPAHAELANQIIESGAVISELHPDDGVSAQTLIARNRITSGLSRAVIVVQSGEDSGSMSTARRARQQGRAVFAVLGGGSGCEELLADGAEPIEPEALDYDRLAARLDAVEIRTAPPPSEQMPLL